MLGSFVVLLDILLHSCMGRKSSEQVQDVQASNSDLSNLSRNFEGQCVCFKEKVDDYLKLDRPLLCHLGPFSSFIRQLINYPIAVIVVQNF